MPLVALVLALLAWAVFGSVPHTFVKWFWSQVAAPWERVDAYYYPNRNDRTVHRVSYDVGSIDDCRAWVRTEAARDGDPGMVRSAYECGVGEIERVGGLTVYRITAK